MDFSELTGNHDRVTVITTEPLTDNESWTKFDKDQIIIFKDGQPVNTG